ncbi:MAG: SpoIIE family protein phosphatase [candidate division Zixibacteria bacterium]|nr:SpoIIE family protein phosphatase [candidate division Zixibacteria bacterium]
MPFRNSTSEHFASFDAERSPLDDIRVFVQNALIESTLTRKEIASLMLAIEEAVTNIIRHGYLYGPGKIRLRVRRNPSWVYITISDSGRAYQVDADAKAPDVQELADSGRKGGLGLALIRKVTDHVEHKRVGDENILTLSKRLRRRFGEPLPKSSWRNRVAYSGVAIITLGVLIGFVVLNEQLQGQETTDFFQKWEQFGRTAAAAASQHILSDRSDAEFDQLVVDLKDAHSGLYYLVILSGVDTTGNNAGIIRAHSESPEKVHESYTPPADVPPATAGHWARSGDSGAVLHFVENARIGGRTVGQVAWGVPVRELDQRLAAVRTRLLQWAGGVLIGGWLLVWLGAAWMARPIQRLADLLRQAKERDVEPPGSTSSDPEEIREVMAAFQEATDTVAREERRVAERTLAKREIEATKHLQDALFPGELPSIPGYEMGAVCRMARHVGGDYYDMIPVNDHQWLVIVADVAGKGLPAALTMTAFRTATRLIARTVSSPRALLTALHQYLAENHPNGPFVTTVCCLLDTETHKLEVASAGHPPVIVRRDDGGQILQLRPSGRPVGIAIGGNVSFEDKLGTELIDLNEADWVLLYTDGVAEARRPDGETFGLDRVGQFLNTNNRLNPTELIDRLVREVDSFSNDAMLKDDLTVVSLRRVPVSTSTNRMTTQPQREGQSAKTSG